MARIDLEYVDFLRVASATAETAKAFVAGTPYAKQEPLDLGPAGDRYKPQPKTGDFVPRGGRA